MPLEMKWITSVVTGSQHQSCSRFWWHWSHVRWLPPTLPHRSFSSLWLFPSSPAPWNCPRCCFGSVVSPSLKAEPAVAEGSQSRWHFPYCFARRLGLPPWVWSAAARIASLTEAYKQKNHLSLFVFFLCRRCTYRSSWCPVKPTEALPVIGRFPFIVTKSVWARMFGRQGGEPGPVAKVAMASPPAARKTNFHQKTAHMTMPEFKDIAVPEVYSPKHGNKEKKTFYWYWW